MTSRGASVLTPFHRKGKIFPEGHGAVELTDDLSLANDEIIEGHLHRFAFEHLAVSPGAQAKVHIFRWHRPCVQQYPAARRAVVGRGPAVLPYQPQ